MQCLETEYSVRISSRENNFLSKTFHRFSIVHRAHAFKSMLWNKKKRTWTSRKNIKSEKKRSRNGIGHKSNETTLMSEASHTKKSVGMALNEATLPLILYRKVEPLNHWACNCENIISHFSTLFSQWHYFFSQCHSFFSFPFFCKKGVHANIMFNGMRYIFYLWHYSCLLLLCGSVRQVRKERLNLLKHPVVGSLLHYKWESFGMFWFLFNLFTYIFFLMFLTEFALLAPTTLEDACMWFLSV